MRGGQFDHEAFYEWAANQPIAVYFSDYTKGSIVWQKTVRSVYNSASGEVYRNETLFAIGGQKQAAAASTRQDKQISIFELKGELT